MLILTRKPGESLYIGDDIKITIVEIKGHQIRVGIDAPREYRIYREEIYLAILEENRKAAEAPAGGELEGLDALKGWGGGPGKGGERKKAKGLASSLGSSGIASVEKPSQKSPEVVVRRKRNRKSDE